MKHWIALSGVVGLTTGLLATSAPLASADGKGCTATRTGGGPAEICVEVTGVRLKVDTVQGYVRPKDGSRGVCDIQLRFTGTLSNGSAYRPAPKPALRGCVTVSYGVVEYPRKNFKDGSRLCVQIVGRSEKACAGIHG